MVGALVVDGGRIVGRGYHQEYGSAHAEVNAIADAKQHYDTLKGMTMVVTLEPCSHHGKTPPCCDLIIKEQFAKVIIAMEDPNPLVAGRGIERLKAAGIEVVLGVMHYEAKDLNKAFIHHIVHKTPYVIMKTAMTLDGKIATASGDSKWVTGKEARKKVHQMRQAQQAIMVGVNTVCIDDPLLTTRLEDFDEKVYLKPLHPIPIVVDSKGRIPLSSRLLHAPEHKIVIIATTYQMPQEKAKSLEALGCQLIYTDTSNGQVDLNDLMNQLGKKGINSILLEGGGTLNYGALSKGIVQEIISFIAPKLIGGDYAKTPVAGTGLSSMADAIEVEEWVYTHYGKDLMIKGKIVRK